MSARDVIACSLDHPSVFMGGPSERNQRKADAILAALSAAGWVVEQGWQPIETAPRDGTPLLLWFPLVSGGQPSGMRHGRWNGKNDMFPWDCGAWSCQADAVTHWRPLPAAPQEDKR